MQEKAPIFFNLFNLGNDLIFSVHEQLLSIEHGLLTVIVWQQDLVTNLQHWLLVLDARTDGNDLTLRVLALAGGHIGNVETTDLLLGLSGNLLDENSVKQWNQSANGGLKTSSMNIHSEKRSVCV